MADRSIARRYARAFIELAAEQGVVDRLGDELARAVTAVRSHDDLAFSALCNPVFTLAERRAVLGELLARLGLHPLTANLLRLLLDKGRFSALPDVLEVYVTQADERAGRARVIVETAEPLSAQLEAAVQQALSKSTGKKVVVETRVRPELIGGIVARVGGTVYDASVKHRLEDIRQRLLGSRIPAEA